MSDDLFSETFWIKAWEGLASGDAHNVHQGFSTAEFWDRVAGSYDRNTREMDSRNLERHIDLFKQNHALFQGAKVLDIGCGTGTLARELARQGAEVTALDFSKGMLERFRGELAGESLPDIDIRLMDWADADLDSLGWVHRFDLVIAFMAPAVSTPEALDKLMCASSRACAIKGWAAKRHHPIMAHLWKEIMGTPLDDNPQTLMIKFNLLFSRGFLPQISFDTMVWKRQVSVEEELERQRVFFEKVSGKPSRELEAVIRPYLESISTNRTITRHHEGVTGTIFWNL